HSDYVHILTMSLLSLRPPPRSPLFPYTTLFRSRVPPGELPARALHGVVVRRPVTEQRNVARTLRGVGIVLQRLHVGHGEAAAAGEHRFETLVAAPLGTILEEERRIEARRVDVVICRGDPASLGVELTWMIVAQAVPLVGPRAGYGKTAVPVRPTRRRA